MGRDELLATGSGELSRLEELEESKSLSNRVEEGLEKDLKSVSESRDSKVRASMSLVVESNSD